MEGHGRTDSIKISASLENFMLGVWRFVGPFFLIETTFERLLLLGT